jgi:catechol 2,3-dioxygenase-like lactoylglutathione lyase family enzyme
MTDTPFRVKQIDHVELYVPDQYEAAEWYRQVFGLEILTGFESWAVDGPLMISSDGGHSKLALFKGEPPGFKPPVGFQRVAFHVDGQGFLLFLNRLAEHPVFDHDGQPAYSLQVVDHDLSYSLYFCDPYGNRYEVTTYDYQLVHDRISP